MSSSLERTLWPPNHASGKTLLDSLDVVALRQLRLCSRELKRIVDEHAPRAFAILHLFAPLGVHGAMHGVDIIGPRCQHLVIKIALPGQSKSHPAISDSPWHQTGDFYIQKVRPHKQNYDWSAPQGVQGLKMDRTIWDHAFMHFPSLATITLRIAGSPAWTGCTRLEETLVLIRLAIERAHLPLLRTVEILPVHAMGIIHLRWDSFGTWRQVSSKGSQAWRSLSTLKLQVKNIGIEPQVTDRQYLMFLKSLHSYLRSFSSTLICLKFMWTGGNGPSPMLLHKESGMEAQQPIYWHRLNELWFGCVNEQRKTLTSLSSLAPDVTIIKKLQRSATSSGPPAWVDVLVPNAFTSHSSNGPSTAIRTFRQEVTELNKRMASSSGTDTIDLIYTSYGSRPGSRRSNTIRPDSSTVGSHNSEAGNDSNDSVDAILDDRYSETLTEYMPQSTTGNATANMVDRESVEGDHSTSSPHDARGTGLQRPGRSRSSFYSVSSTESGPLTTLLKRLRRGEQPLGPGRFLQNRQAAPTEISRPLSPHLPSLSHGRARRPRESIVRALDRQLDSEAVSQMSAQERIADWRRQLRLSTASFASRMNMKSVNVGTSHDASQAERWLVTHYHDDALSRHIRDCQTTKAATSVPVGSATAARQQEAHQQNHDIDLLRRQILDDMSQHYEYDGSRYAVKPHATDATYDPRKGRASPISNGGPIRLSSRRSRSTIESSRSSQYLQAHGHGPGSQSMAWSMYSEGGAYGEGEYKAPHQRQSRASVFQRVKDLL